MSCYLILSLCHPFSHPRVRRHDSWPEMVNRQMMTIFLVRMRTWSLKESGTSRTTSSAFGLRKLVGREWLDWEWEHVWRCRWGRWGDYQKPIYNISHLRHQLTKWRCSIQHWNMEFRNEVQVGCKLEHFHPEDTSESPGTEWDHQRRKGGKGRSVIPEPGGQSDHFQLRKSLLSSPSPSLFLSPVSSASFPILKPPVL